MVELVEFKCIRHAKGQFLSNEKSDYSIVEPTPQLSEQSRSIMKTAE